MAYENSSKIITLALIIVISIAAITVLYVNLAEDDNNKDMSDLYQEEEEPEEAEPLLTVIFGDYEAYYNITELELLDSSTGNGTFIKTGWLPTVNLEGPNEYTGCLITKLLEKVDNLPENYTIIISSSDGKTSEYNLSQIQGNVDIYNESGVITETGGVYMIVAYKKDGNYITDSEEGPLRIAFVDEDRITASNLWTRMVVSIEIIEEQ